MIRFSADHEGLVLTYSPDNVSGGWIRKELESSGEVTISRVFTLEGDDLLGEPFEDHDDLDVDGESEFRFRFATRDGPYHRIKGRVFGIANDVLLPSSGIKVERRLFVADRNVSIFLRLAKIVGPAQDIILGGDQTGSIPLGVFEELLTKFPNSTELDHYANARVSNILGEYLDGLRDFRAHYEAYLDRRRLALSGEPTFEPKDLLRTEIDKFTLIRDTIREWLRTSAGRSEKEWQAMILKFILLLFPKYIAVLENVKIEDHYSKPGSTRGRYIDIALVDANGNIDVIEIKRPFDDILLSRTPYRDNFVPTKDLSGTIMQAEKYLFHLSKWGVAGEAKLTKKYGSQLPPGMSIRITNPKALVIVGRDRTPGGEAALDQHQMFDLEVTKRKYANMMDILTYDDLLRRLDNTIASLEQRSAKT